MSWGFRRSLKLAPGLRLNVGKRGLGLSAGGRGARISANTRGERRFSLSRLGFFWRRKL